jgi:ankyrin repeat protein
MISLLLKNTADIEAKENGSGTPLAWAIEIGSEITLRTLLERGSVVNYWYKLVSRSGSRKFL